MAQESIKSYPRSFNVNEKLLSSIDNGIIILDTNLQIHHFNSWLEIRTSLKEVDLIGSYIHKIFPNINEKTLQRKINTALLMGTPTFYTASTSKYLIPIKINQINVSRFKHMRQDVSIIPFDAKNKFVALIITDQTNIINTNILLKENIKKVQELNSELIKERDTIDKKILFIKVDTNNVITDVSQALLELLEYEKSDILKLNYFEYQKLHISQELKSQIVENITEKKVFTFESKLLTNSAKELTIFNTLVSEYDSYAQHLGFIFFMQDITSSKKLIHQQEKLLSTSRSAAMGEMIGMIAHQWRQPLSLITTIISTIRVKHDLNILTNENIEESLLKVEETIHYLSDTIDDFRNYFKPNKIILRTYIHQIIEKSTTFLLEEMKSLNISYVFHRDSSNDFTIETYQNELIQCIINIIKNSMDAFEEQHNLDKKITIKIEKHSTHLALYFHDNAGGIAPETLPYIFDPYFSTKSKNGTGLGLYMTKKIIEENLHGKITVTSSKGETNTLLELPYYLKNNTTKNKDKV